MKMKVYRDAEGRVVNVGEWDFQIERELVLDGETQLPVYDRREDGGLVQRTRQVMRNPLPAGYTEGEADIVQGWDGGLYEANDPRRAGPQEP